MKKTRTQRGHKRTQGEPNAPSGIGNGNGNINGNEWGSELHWQYA
jgi:hypothetical protein